MAKKNKVEEPSVAVEEKTVDIETEVENTLAAKSVELSTAVPKVIVEPNKGEFISVRRNALYKLAYCMLTDKVGNMVGTGTRRTIADILGVSYEEAATFIEESKQFIFRQK